MVKYDVDNSGALDLNEFRTLVDELRRFQGKPGADDEVHRIFTRCAPSRRLPYPKSAHPHPNGPTLTVAW